MIITVFSVSRLFLRFHLYYELILFETRNLKRCFVAVLNSKFFSVQKGENIASLSLRHMSLFSVMSDTENLIAFVRLIFAVNQSF